MVDAENARMDNTNDLQKTETIKSKNSKNSKINDASKLSDDIDADEEDNSMETTQTGMPKNKRPALTLLKFAENPDPFEF